MTIMTQGDSNGTRRCDGTCHNAKKPKCSCICGGRYHGAGSSEAAQEQLTKDWLGQDWKEKKAEIEAQGGSFQVIVSKALQLAMISLLLVVGLAACHDEETRSESTTEVCTVNGERVPC